jgi:nucleotide-binding universal stress UspA family protein
MLNVQHILFPTDFSHGAQQAFPHAVSFASEHDAALHILNVAAEAPPDPEASDFPMPLDILVEWLDSATTGTDAEALLDGLSITQTQVEAPSASDRIVAYAEDTDIDLIAMGTHGRRGLQRMLFGSVTEAVVRTAPCPVLTVRSKPTQPPNAALGRILVPVDFSEGATVAVRHARELAQHYGATIDLLHVVREVVYPSAYGFEPAAFSMDELLDRAQERLGELARTEGGDARILAKATAGPPSRSILDYVKNHTIDLVVLATHGRSGLDRFLVGSVAERVLRRAPTPVLVVAADRKSLVPSEASPAPS